VARVARFIIERFWAPVGSGVQPTDELRFLAATLLGGPEGEAAARKVDDTIRRLPGMEGVPLLGAWIERETPAVGPRMHNHGVLDCNVA